MLSNLLSSCGLNQSEQSVLLHLLRRGATTASLIAKAVGFKRPTVYAILENLVIRDLVVKQKKREATYFSALNASMIPKILVNQANKKYAEMKTAADLLTPYLTEISRKSENNFGSFEITSFESIESVYAMLIDSLIGGDFDAIFNPQTAQSSDQTVAIVQEFLRHTAKTKPHIREIAVAGSVTDLYKSKIKNPNHVVREIHEDKEILSDMILINGSVVIIGYGKGRESAIKIIEPDFYASMKTMFEILWATSDQR